MSNLARIGLVTEGPTDQILLEAALRAILQPREFVLTRLQPEESAAFGAIGAGWAGVYRWCRQAAKRGGGTLRDDSLLYAQFDLVVLQIDADVAGASYSDGSIALEAGVKLLPCEQPCPPPSASTDPLREVVLSWCGESGEPPQTVVVTPSKSIEAWLVLALFPTDRSVKSGIECFPDPAKRLGVQTKRKRIKKSVMDYRKKAEEFEAAWPSVRGLVEAGRFEMRVHQELP